MRLLLSRSVCGVSAAVLVIFGAGGTAIADDGGFTIKDPRIKESSGLAASRLHPGIYWTHNDSDDGPYLYAVDSKTWRTVSTVTMKGVGSPRDVEAVSIGPDGDLYLTGRLELEHLDEDELDRVIGELYAITESWFQPALRIAFPRRPS